MECNLEGISPQDLQQRFRLAEHAPEVQTGKDSCVSYNYYFEFDDVRLGDIEVTDNPHRHHISWWRFYPFAVHLTPDQVRVIKWIDESFIQEQGMDYLRRTLSDPHTVPQGLESNGLGTLAHTLVVRHLCRHVMNADAYTTSYGSAKSIEPRLKDMIERVGAKDMMVAKMPLMQVQAAFTEGARRIFGFQFEDMD